MKQTIRIKYFTDKIDKLAYIGGKSDWIDLRAAERVELKKGEFKLIPLGVALALPKGYEAHVVPRSSTFKTYGVIQANSMGSRANSYWGPNEQCNCPAQWKVPGLGGRDSVIAGPDRICQFRIMENQPELVFEEDSLEGNADRGGYGTTGRQ